MISASLIEAIAKDPLGVDVDPSLLTVAALQQMAGMVIRMSRTIDDCDAENLKLRRALRDAEEKIENLRKPLLRK